MKGLFWGLALHMTAIWGYCVFWPKRVVYDRWQGRKSRAAGSNTDMQIAFSWLLYSLRYLSSGLQHACLFTARKQLITSTKGERKEIRCFRWFHSVACKLRPLKWPASAVKLVHKCAVFHHTKADTTEERRCLLIFSFQMLRWIWSELSIEKAIFYVASMETRRLRGKNDKLRTF